MPAATHWQREIRTCYHRPRGGSLQAAARRVYNFCVYSYPQSQSLPARCLHAPVAGALLSLFVLSGCGQPPDSSAAAQYPREAPALPEPSATPPAAPAVPAAKPTGSLQPVAKTPALESLVLTPEDAPFAVSATHTFGEVRDADWIAAAPPRSPQDRLLPDLFEDTANQGRMNVEGELLLDDSQETSRMVDGASMKLKISTD